MKKTLASQITKYHWKGSSSGLLEVMTEQEKNCVNLHVLKRQVKVTVPLVKLRDMADEGDPNTSLAFHISLYSRRSRKLKPDMDAARDQEIKFLALGNVDVYNNICTSDMEATLLHRPLQPTAKLNVTRLPARKQSIDSSTTNMPCLGFEPVNRPPSESLRLRLRISPGFGVGV
ncbi:hypothetical protein NA56DRAFT_705244 [Hyaloscypha hepaticicola]|uniref:Uncharacterized protein n=1 Tax=Hyaloscypha hepaticicola TaxID=2082293 RepID=A0A2J6Q142_9HELO|nr:hypothetical protein NA56DRAFT_705244 [Hyaloscypha hepaticicola]